MQEPLSLKYASTDLSQGAATAATQTMSKIQCAPRCLPPGEDGLVLLGRHPHPHAGTRRQSQTGGCTQLPSLCSTIAHPRQLDAGSHPMALRCFGRLCGKAYSPTQLLLSLPARPARSPPTPSSTLAPDKPPAGPDLRASPCRRCRTR